MLNNEINMWIFSIIHSSWRLLIIFSRSVIRCNFAQSPLDKRSQATVAGAAQRPFPEVQTMAKVTFCTRPKFGNSIFLVLFFKISKKLIPVADQRTKKYSFYHQEINFWCKNGRIRPFLLIFTTMTKTTKKLKISCFQE